MAARRSPPPPGGTAMPRARDWPACRLQPLASGCVILARWRTADMRYAFRAGLAVAAMLAAAPLRPAAAQERVDLLLVLAADVSRSMTNEKFQMQRQGYVDALINPRVIQAIQSGINRRIAATFIEWGGVGSQKVVVDWSIISDEATARRFVDELAEAPRSFTGRTSISAALDFSMAQLERAPYDAERRTIDVSGDGVNNSGRPIRHARDDALAKGATINGLVVADESPDPGNPEKVDPREEVATYYRDNVVGGPGGFVMVAESFESFGHALINKLVAEIAQTPGPRYAGLRQRR